MEKLLLLRTLIMHDHEKKNDEPEIPSKIGHVPKRLGRVMHDQLINSPIIIALKP